MKIRKVAIKDLVLDPENPRLHDERNLGVIQSSLKTFGQVEPLVVQKGTMRVIGGNGRVAALQSMGEKLAMVNEVDVTDDEARALSIVLNRSAELASWNLPVLEAHLKTLVTHDIAMELVGFDPRELQDLVASLEPATREEPILIPVPTKPVTKHGDVWEIGPHRIVCGDSLKQETAAIALEGEPADMAFTDPPYNVDYGTVNRPRKERDSKKGRFSSKSMRARFPARQPEKAIVNDAMGPEAWAKFCQRIAEVLRVNVKGCVYVCHGSLGEARKIVDALAASLHESDDIVWKKDVFVIGSSKYQREYEMIWFGWTNDGAYFTEDRSLPNVWEVPRPKSSKQHPTMKPPELAMRAMRHATKPGDRVFDPFMGSGSTLVAAHREGRRGIGVEIDPGYCDVAVDFLQKETGLKARRL